MSNQSFVAGKLVERVARGGRKFLVGSLSHPIDLKRGVKVLVFETGRSGDGLRRFELRFASDAPANVRDDAPEANAAQAPPPRTSEVSVHLRQPSVPIDPDRPDPIFADPPTTPFAQQRPSENPKRQKRRERRAKARGKSLDTSARTLPAPGVVVRTDYGDDDPPW